MDKEVQNSHSVIRISFLYIIFFIALCISFFSLVGILHVAINKLIPDTTESLSFYSPDKVFLQWYIAGILVAYPIFAFLYLLINAWAIKNPEIKEVRLRRILINLTLTGTFFIMLIYLIMSVSSLLNGNTALRSLAHFGLTLLIACSIFLSLIHMILQEKK